MAQPRVVIVDKHNGQLMGAQIDAILQQEDSYQVDICAEIPPDVQSLVAVAAREHHAPYLRSVQISTHISCE